MIITLCGSARFEKLFHVWNEILTLSGHTVFGLAVYPSWKNGEKNWYSDAEKAALDMAHLRKIDASEAVLIINHLAYIGPSTLREIRYAREAGKKMFAIESWGKGCGVSGNHCEAYQDAAKRITGSPRTSSPIATTWPHFGYPFDLLGSSGEVRSMLVGRVNRAEAEMLKA